MILHSRIKRELRTPHLWICYSTKALWITILSTKALTHFQRWCIVRELPIATKVAIVNNIESTIQVGKHTPRVVYLDTNAQPMIFRVQFAKKMGMLDSKLWKYVINLHC